MPKILIPLPEVKRRTGKSKSAIYDEMAKGTFPRPVKNGAQAVAWVDQEVDAYIDRKIAARDGKAA